MGTFDLPVRYFRFYPGDDPQGATDKVITLSTDDTALLLVDVYHAAEKPAAKELVNTTWDRAWWRVVENCLAPLVEAARHLGLPMVYVTNSSPRIAMGRSAFGYRLRESLGFDPEVDFREAGVDPREYCAGEPVQLVFPARIAPRPDDYYVRKHTYSGFFDTRLDSLLRNLGARNLLVAGFVADCCLLFTTADAVFRGYHTVVMRDCTLAAELPHEVETLAQTQRILLWIESILGPTAVVPDFLAATAALAGSAVSN